MIYGDNPDEDNPRPDIEAILQSGNIYVYCINNPTRYMDKTGELARPGEIHDAVVNHIYNKYSKFGNGTGQMLLYKEKKILYTEEQKNQYNSRGGYGRADLLCDDGRVWEVKPNHLFQVVRGIGQVNRYIKGHWSEDANLKLRLGDAAFGPDEFTHRSGSIVYNVSYTYIGNGLIVYKYSIKDIIADPVSVKVKVLTVVGFSAALFVIAFGSNEAEREIRHSY